MSLDKMYMSGKYCKIYCRIFLCVKKEKCLGSAESSSEVETSCCQQKLRKRTRGPARISPPQTDALHPHKTIKETG